MTSIAPGLVGDTIASAAFRAYLGAPPQLAVERRLLRHMHITVGSWFLTRRRIREQANEFLEFDATTPDPEIMLRHCHIFFLRRQLFSDILEKQLAVLEGGKPPREPDPEVYSCLTEINESLTLRLNYERRRLEHSKLLSTIPHRRELQPSEPLDKWDYLCMQRCLESDMVPNLGAGGDCEGQAKAFLPLSSVADSAEKLAQHFIRIASSASTDAIPPEPKFDKKDEKLGVKAFVPGDYTKTGLNSPRMRPVDATAYFRFYGERALTNHLAATEMKRDPSSFFFRRALWGNVFRRFATDAPFLSHSMSQYWANRAGIHENPPFLKMPLDLAATVCERQLRVTPATNLRTQYLYAHHDLAKQLWRSDLVFPSMRMLSATGSQCAEDMLASVLVDALFAELQPQGGTKASATTSSSSDNSADAKKQKQAQQQQQQQQQQSGTVTLLSDEKIRQILTFVNDMASARSRALDTVLQRAVSAAKNVVVPPLTEEEANWNPEPIQQAITGGEGDKDDGDAADNGDDDEDGEFVLVEEGIPETETIPGENLEVGGGGERK